MTRTRKHGLQRTPPSGTDYAFEELNPIDELIPFNRRFLKLGTGKASKPSRKESGFFGRVTRVLKGLFGGARFRELERQEVVRLRRLVGDLKGIKTVSTPFLATESDLSEDTQAAKSKKELLDEKRKRISQKAKEGRKDKDQIGLRIEIEKLKKKYPADGNLVLLDAILTSRDGCLPHRSIDERVASLYAALNESGQLVADQFLTTYSIDTLFDIYFLYLESLKKLFLERQRSLKEKSTVKHSAPMKSLQRDFKLLNLLLGQSKLKKTIQNVAQKLNGFGYPYVSMSNLFVSKSFSAEPGTENQKIGPGTVKLNRFLVRIYLNILSQIPIFSTYSRSLMRCLAKRSFEQNHDSECQYRQCLYSAQDIQSD